MNMGVAKVGTTTKYTSGVVKGLNATVYYQNTITTINGMVKSHVYQSGGDSGGPVIIPRADFNGGSFGVGIVSGGDSMNNTMFFTDIRDLPSSLKNRY